MFTRQAEEDVLRLLTLKGMVPEQYHPEINTKVSMILNGQDPYPGQP